ncbi:hypothetical protein M9458_043058, partial [Cirrhinus mrigala]
SSTIDPSSLLSSPPTSPPLRSTNSTRLPRSFRLPIGQLSTVRDSAPLATPHPSIPLALSGSSFRPTPLRPSGFPSPPRSLEPSAPPWPSIFLASSWLVGSPSPPQAPLSPVLPPSIGPLESSALPPPWLLPLSAPPWVALMAMAWVPSAFSCSKYLLSSPWLLPSSPPWSFVTLASPQPSGFPSLPRLLEPSAPPWPSRFSASSWLVGSPSPPQAPLPPVLPPPSSTMAPPSVGSTVGCLHGYGLGPVCLLLLQVPPVFSLAPSSISTLVICHSGFTTALRIPASALVIGAICSSFVLQILGVTLARRFSVSASGSTTTCSAAIDRPPGVGSPSSTMAPPSIGSTVGLLYGCGLDPTCLLLLQVSPVFSLAPPSISTLVFCHSGSTTAFRTPASATVTGAICFSLVLRILGVTLARQPESPPESK